MCLYLYNCIEKFRESTYKATTCTQLSYTQVAIATHIANIATWLAIDIYLVK